MHERKIARELVKLAREVVSIRRERRKPFVKWLQKQAKMLERLRGVSNAMVVDMVDEFSIDVVLDDGRGAYVHLEVTESGEWPVVKYDLEAYDDADIAVANDRGKFEMRDPKKNQVYHLIKKYL